MKFRQFDILSSFQEAVFEKISHYYNGIFHSAEEILFSMFRSTKLISRELEIVCCPFMRIKMLICFHNIFY